MDRKREISAVVNKVNFLKILWQNRTKKSIWLEEKKGDGICVQSTFDF
jgi:hypothetical protein